MQHQLMRSGPGCVSRPSACPRQLRSVGLPVRTQARCQATKEEDRDLVTNLVGKLFGEKALEDRNPFGMARMDWSKVKDLEVIMDRDAAPRATDDPYMALLRPMLAGTSLEEEDLRLAYSATEDGWTGADFIARVTGYGPCIIMARSQGGAVFGGYNPLGFDGQGADKGSMGAFLYTWPDGDTKNKKPYKLPKIGTEAMSVIDKPDTGPHFGPADLKILLQKGRDCAKATSKLVDYARPNGAKTVFSKDEGTKTEVVELRAYVRKGGKLKYELDGVRWKSSFVKDGSGEGPPPGIFSM